MDKFLEPKERLVWFLVDDSEYSKIVPQGWEKIPKRFKKDLFVGKTLWEFSRLRTGCIDGMSSVLLKNGNVRYHISMIWIDTYFHGTSNSHDDAEEFLEELDYIAGNKEQQEENPELYEWIQGIKNIISEYFTFSSPSEFSTQEVGSCSFGKPPHASP